MQYTSLWKDPSIHCFRKVVTQMDVLLDKLLDEHFGRFNKLKEYMRFEMSPPLSVDFHPLNLIWQEINDTRSRDL